MQMLNLDEYNVSEKYLQLKPMKERKLQFEENIDFIKFYIISVKLRL